MRQNDLRVRWLVAWLLVAWCCMFSSGAFGADPPSLAERNMGVVLRDGARSYMRDMMSDVKPIGEKDFLYVGNFESNEERPFMKIGDRVLEGFNRNPWQPSSMVVAPRETCGYVARMTPEGHVKWFFGQKEGSLAGLKAATVGDITYVLLHVKPTNKLDRAEEDNTVTIWYNQKGEEWKIERPFDHAKPDKFFVPYYTFLIKLSADGSVLESKEIFHLKKRHKEPTSSGYLRLLDLSIHDGKVRIITRLGNAVISVGEGSGAREIASKHVSGSEYDLLFIELDGNKCSRLEMLTPSGVPLEKQWCKVVSHSETGTILSYQFERHKDAAASDTYTLFGTPLQIKEKGTTQIVFKVNAAWDAIAWQVQLPRGVEVLDLAPYGDSIYATGGFSRNFKWGKHDLEEWEDCDGTGFWGTLSDNTGAYGQGHAIKSGFAEGAGIGVDQERVYVSFWYQESYMNGTEREEYCYVDFGNGNKYPFAYAYNPCVGFAAFTRSNGDFVTYIPMISSEDYIDMRTFGPLLSHDMSHLTTTGQSGTPWGAPRDITVYGKVMPTKAEDYYNGYVELIQILRLRCDITLEARKGTSLKLIYTHNGKQVEEQVQEASKVVRVPYGSEVQFIASALNGTDQANIAVPTDPKVATAVAGKDNTYSVLGDFTCTSKLTQTVVVTSNGCGTTKLTWADPDGSSQSAEVRQEVKALEILPNSVVTVTAVADTHNQLKEVLFDGETKGSGDSFTVGQKGIAINVTFLGDAFKYNDAQVKAGEGQLKLMRTVNGAEQALEVGDEVRYGEMLTLGWEPTAGWAIDGSTIEVTGLQHQKDQTYMVTGDVTIAASFIKLVTITVTQDPNGKSVFEWNDAVAGAKSVTVKKANETILVWPGSKVKITAIANQYYNAKIAIKGNEHTSGQEFEFSADSDVKISFERIVYKYKANEANCDKGTIALVRIVKTTFPYSIKRIPINIGEDVNAGEEIDFDIKPTEGYQLKAGSLNASEGIERGNSANWLAIADITIRGEWEDAPKLNVANGEHGTVEIKWLDRKTYKNQIVTLAAGESKNIYLLPNTNFTIISKPETHYKAKITQDGTVDVPSGKTINFKGNTTLKVDYERITYTFATHTVTPDGTGKLRLVRTDGTGEHEIALNETVYEGELLKVMPQAEAGYYFKQGSLVVEGLAASTGGNYEVTGNVSLSGTFGELMKVTLTAGERGSCKATYKDAAGDEKVVAVAAKGSEEILLMPGTEVAINATAEAGYFSLISVNGGVAEKKESLTFTADAHTTISVTFEAITYTVTYAQPANGTLSVVDADGQAVASGSKVKENATITITATPTNADTHELESLTVNGTAITNGSQQAVTADITIVAKFREKSIPAPASTYTVTYAQPENGSLSVADADGKAVASGSKVKENATITITATPTNADTHELESLTVNGAAIANGSQQAVTADITIVAKFREKQGVIVTPIESATLIPLTIAPNPASTTIMLVGLEGEQLVQLFSTNGQKVLEVRVSSGMPIDISSLSAGVYLVRAGNGLGKLVIAR